MPGSVYKVIEIVGTSSTSWEDAAATAVERASQTLRDLRVAEVTEQDVQRVLNRHGITDGETLERTVELCQGTNSDRIEAAVLYYVEFDEQVDSALDEIEDILIEAGIIAAPKLFEAP